MAYFIDPALCDTFASYVQVVKEGEAIGQSMVDSGGFYRKSANAVIATDVDHKAFMKMFFKRLFPTKSALIDAMEGVL